eukprot:5367510-Pyramimonas_sp.AAC.1
MAQMEGRASCPVHAWGRHWQSLHDWHSTHHRQWTAAWAVSHQWEKKRPPLQQPLHHTNAHQKESAATAVSNQKHSAQPYPA